MSLPTPQLPPLPRAGLRAQSRHLQVRYGAMWGGLGPFGVLPGEPASGRSASPGEVWSVLNQYLLSVCWHRLHVNTADLLLWSDLTQASSSGSAKGP